MHTDAAEVAVFLVLCGLVTGVGFFAARWRRGDLHTLQEWGLAGRRFGTVVTWFLIGGDLYTAYTFIAVPALVYGAGAMGFFALPYTIIAYPLVLPLLPRLWNVSRRHGYITAADFVHGRFDSRMLAALVAATGILATMPYIALQLVGMAVVFAALGFQATGWWADAPLLAAFAVLAAYTYTSGLRAPALVAIVKDLLVYVAVIGMVVVLPLKLGGYAHIFAAAPKGALLLAAPHGGNLGQYSMFVTLAVGSAMALFLYPHAVTGVLSSQGPRVLRRNMAILPAYSIMLGLIALLGYMALAGRVATLPAGKVLFKAYGANAAVPALVATMLPGWFAGVVFAAVAIGALVPAAIMSIAAANLFTRNIYRAWLHPACTDRREASVAKLASLLVKFGALVFVVAVPAKYAIQLQFLGGVWMLQTLPAVAIGLYTRRLHRGGLAAGLLAGMASGTWMLWQNHFAGTMYTLHAGGITVPAYAGIDALVVNLVVCVAATALLRAVGVSGGKDATAEADYRDEAAGVVAAEPELPAALE